MSESRTADPKVKRARPRVVSMRPRVIDYTPEFVELPRCEQEVSTPSTINWRAGRQEQIAKAQRLGVGLFQCFQTATYKIGDSWYCRKHAALIALDMLAEEP